MLNGHPNRHTAAFLAQLIAFCHERDKLLWLDVKKTTEDAGMDLNALCALFKVSDDELRKWSSYRISEKQRNYLDDCMLQFTGRRRRKEKKPTREPVSESVIEIKKQPEDVAEWYEVASIVGHARCSCGIDCFECVSYYLCLSLKIFLALSGSRGKGITSVRGNRPITYGYMLSYLSLFNSHTSVSRLVGR